MNVGAAASVRSGLTASNDEGLSNPHLQTHSFFLGLSPQPLSIMKPLPCYRGFRSNKPRKITIGALAGDAKVELLPDDLRLFSG